MMMKYSIVFSLFLLIAIHSCNVPQQIEKLPVMGKIDAKFVFVNQDSAFVTEKTVRSKIYVTDFFFTTCPTICPKMKAQMIRIHDRFKERDDFLLLSHSIDQKDSVTVLNDYAKRLEVVAKDWQFVTGKRQDIFRMAKTYMVTAGADANAPGGYIHSGAFVLIDKKGQVRGFYDGTLADKTDELMRDIDKLLNEKKPSDE